MEGFLSVWFVFLVVSLAYVTFDLFNLKGSWIIKLGWWLVVLYTGVVGLFFYLKLVKKHGEGDIHHVPLGGEVLLLSVVGGGVGLTCFFLNHFFLVPNGSLPMLGFEYLCGVIFGVFVYQGYLLKKMTANLFRFWWNRWLAQIMIVNGLGSGFFLVQMLWNAYYPESRDTAMVYFWGMLTIAYTVGAFTLYPVVVWQARRGYIPYIVMKKGLSIEQLEVKGVTAMTLTHKLLWSVLGLLASVCIGYLLVQRIYAYSISFPISF